MIEAEAVEFRNVEGSVRWHPKVGKHHYMDTLYGPEWHDNATCYGCMGVRLYRSRKRALRIAQRFERRQRRYTYVGGDS